MYLVTQKHAILSIIVGISSASPSNSNGATDMNRLISPKVSEKKALARYMIFVNGITTEN